MVARELERLYVGEAMGRPSSEHVEQLLLSKIRHLVSDGLELDSIAAELRFEAFSKNLDVSDKLAHRIFGLLVKVCCSNCSLRCQNKI